MSASNPARPEPTEIAGRFQVVQKLGAGAFGTVYKAKDKVLGRMLAIKTIRLEGLAASQTGLAEMLERFQREARVAAQLKHPNIVTIYDIGEAEGMSYISMEFIDGVGIEPRSSSSPAGCPSSAPPRWRRRWPTGSTTLTSTASCTATSSPRTSWSSLATG